jgi:UAA transporter family
MANIVVGYAGRRIVGGTEGLPMKQFYISGAAQVFAKAFTSLALAKGLSFPIATLAKSGKMAPVMAGQLLLGGSSYAFRDYLQVAAIITGTAILSLGKKVMCSFKSISMHLHFACCLFSQLDLYRRKVVDHNHPLWDLFSSFSLS